jgi:predicted DsbA family dithiol-disulfide isomerase
MVEAIEFPHLANKYGVQGVPRTIINENTTIEGSVPEPLFVAKVLEAVGLMTPEEVATMVDEVSAGVEEASPEERRD